MLKFKKRIIQAVVYVVLAYVGATVFTSLCAGQRLAVESSLGYTGLTSGFQPLTCVLVG